MKYKKSLMLLLVVFVIGILSACGKTSIGGLKAGEIKEISYEELIEKLDNKETFLLLSDHYEYDEYIDAGLSEVIKERLEEQGVGVYYARSYLKKEDEGKYEELASYVHPENEIYDGVDFWRPASDGLVYVDEGRIVTLTSSQIFIENSNATPFSKQMDIHDVTNHEYYGDSITQSLMKYEDLDFE